MSIGMRYQKFGDCEVACVICGSNSKLCQVAHRNTLNKVIGYLFVCNEEGTDCCFNTIQRCGITILGNKKLAKK